MVMTIPVSVAWLTQLVERQTLNLGVVSSSHVVGVKFFLSGVRVFLFFIPIGIGDVW